MLCAIFTHAQQKSSVKDTSLYKPDSAALQLYIGEYEYDRMVTKVYIKNNVLMITPPDPSDPNAPDIELVATSNKHEFDFKLEELKAKEVRIKFVVSENKATSCNLIETNGNVLVAFKRKE
jgi:hypothetical protein